MSKAPILTKSISSLLFFGAISAIQTDLHAQATISWDGGGIGDTILGTATNWTGDILPSPLASDTAQWDGTVLGPLSLVYSDAAFAGAIGNLGINLALTAAQLDSLNIDSGVNTAALRMNNLTIDAGAGAFSMGDGANVFNLTLGGAGGQTHTWTNNSSNTALVNSDVVWGLGGGGVHTLAATGSGNWTFNNTIAPTTTTLTIAKSGAGTLTLGGAGANTFTGGVVLNAGTLNINKVTALGTGALTINGGTIDNSTAGALVVTATLAQNWNGDFTFAGTQNLTFGATGTGLTLLGGSGTTRQVTVNANTLNIGQMFGNGFGLTKAGAGTLQLSTTSNGTANIITGSLNVTGGKFAIGGRDFVARGLAGAGTIENGSGTTRWLFLQNDADNLYSGVLQNGAGAGLLGLVKGGTKTLTLTGTNTYTSQTTIWGGTLEFGSSTTAGITQSVGNLVFARGDGATKSSFNGTGTANLTFLASEARTAGATGNFIISGGTNGVDNRINLTKAAGFIDQGTFFGGSDYAVMDGLNTFVRPLAYGTDAGAVTSGAAATLAGTLYQEFTGDITAQDTATFTTLKDSGNNAFTLNTGATVTTNGILKAGNVAGGATISGGTGIQAATGAELVVRTDGVNDALTISTPILANGANALTKSGAGTLTVGANNTFTGAINASGGTLNLTGTNATAAAINVDGGVLNLSNSFTAGTTQISLNGVLNILPGASLSRNNLLVGTDKGLSGAVYQTGGALTLVQVAGVNNFQLGSGPGGYGYYNISGGTLTLNEIGVGGSSNINTVGVMDVKSGGTVADAGWITVGRGGGTSSGVLNVDGGTITVGARVNINWAGAAGAQSIINVKNGSITIAGATNVGLDLANTATAGTLGEVNLLSGGTITTGIVTASNAGPTALLNFNGGTLKATATNGGANFMTNANIDGVFVYGGGGTIDNSGTNITVNRPLLAPTGDGVSSIATTGGTGYIGAPMVVISGGGGTGATATAAIDGSGNLTGITITNPGTGYTSTPNVALVGGGGSGASTGAVSLLANTSGGVTFAGAGVTTLAGASTYTGNVAVNAGTLSVTTGNVGNPVNGSLGNSTVGGRTVTVASGATLAFAANDIFGNQTAIAANLPSLIVNGAFSTTRYNQIGALTLNGATMSSNNVTDSGNYQNFQFLGDVTVGGSTPSTISATGAANFNGNHLSTATTFNVANATGDASTDLTVSAPLRNQSGNYANAPGGLVKTGAGTMLLSAANTYTGSTVITAGTLALTGSISGSPSINVQSGANFDVSGVGGGFAVASGQTLTGSGTVIGSTTIGAGAFLVPGSSPGTLTTSSLSLDPASTAVFELTLGDTTVGGGINDLVVVNGDFTLDGTIQISELGGPISDGLYTLFDYSGTLTDNGLTIDPGFLSLHPDAFITIDTVNTTVLIAVPEPGSIASLVGGLGLLVGMRRRRRS